MVYPDSSYEIKPTLVNSYKRVPGLGIGGELLGKGEQSAGVESTAPERKSRNRERNPSLQSDRRVGARCALLRAFA